VLLRIALYNPRVEWVWARGFGFPHPMTLLFWPTDIKNWAAKVVAFNLLNNPYLACILRRKGVNIFALFSNIRLLAHRRYAVREQAAQALFEAFRSNPYFVAAILQLILARSPDAETKTRIERLLQMGIRQGFWWAGPPKE
jgi:hypothetical protein